MKTKILLATLFALAIGLLKGYSQNEPSMDDKILVMKEIESLPEKQGRPLQEWWKEAREVEDWSLLFGYASYGAPWGSPALHGGTIGLSISHVMISLDMGLGSIIDEAAYNNTEAYNYLKANSTQGFGFLTVHYYLIKYLSFGVGVGFHSELQKNVSTQIEPHGSYSIENDKITFLNTGFFGLRFGAKAYIPVSDRLSFYLSTDYDVMPSSTRKSKLDLGVGVKIAID